MHAGGKATITANATEDNTISASVYINVVEWPGIWATFKNVVDASIYQGQTYVPVNTGTLIKCKDGNYCVILQDNSSIDISKAESASELYSNYNWFTAVIDRNTTVHDIAEEGSATVERGGIVYDANGNYYVNCTWNSQPVTRGMNLSDDQYRQIWKQLQ